MSKKLSMSPARSNVEERKIKVLYIAGWGRSGTTLLDNILGQVDGFFSGGELRYIWERGFIENRKCGCGRKFRDCPTWQNILRYALGDKINPGSLNEMTHRYTRTMRILRLMGLRRSRRISREFREYLSVIEALYLGIAHETKSRLVIDSSKFPAYGGMLRLIPSLDVYLLHLVRDPHAVAYSWMTSKSTSDFETRTFLPKIDPVASTLWWNGWNLAIEYMGTSPPGRYLLINYENLAANPRSTAKEILAFLDEGDAGLPFVNETTVKLGENHIIAGNPNRFDRGNIVIRPDTRWFNEMNPFHKSIVKFISSPVRRRFGY